MKAEGGDRLDGPLVGKRRCKDKCVNREKACPL